MNTSGGRQPLKQSAYDLHMHSCLSPCGDNDMTPGNMCAMAVLAGLEVIALTDHNTCGNVRVFCERAAEQGLVGVPGMELTTREEIHVVCLFADCGSAEDFSRFVYQKLPDIPNKPALFGSQYLIGEDDEPRGEEPRLLLGAADIGIYDVAALAKQYGAMAFPAHIDRDAFSLLAVLGLWDDGLDFSMFELSARGEELLEAGALTPPLPRLPFLVNSDAHRLEAIPDARRKLKIGSPTARAVIDALKLL